MRIVPDVAEVGSVVIDTNLVKNNKAQPDPDFALLRDARRSAPVFPLAALGDYWAKWIETRSAGASAPTDYVASSLIASCAAMIGNSRWPRAGANWIEPPILWCCIVGSPSSSKSPAMSAAFSLVAEAEEQMSDGFDELQLQHIERVRIAKLYEENWEAEVKKAIKAGNGLPERPLASFPPEAPVKPRVRVMDATTEKLGYLSAATDRSLLLQRDELAGWLGSFDKYGGAGSDRAFALEMYGGGRYVVDRVKNANHISVRHLSVGVIGGIQPDRLQSVLKGADDGFLSRFLWSWPDTLPDFAISRSSVDDTRQQAAFARLSKLDMQKDEAGRSDPVQISLTPQAVDALERFGKHVQRLARNASGTFAGSLGKARGHALRLATVLEYLWWCSTGSGPEPHLISEKAVQSAITLMADYFIPMAERVLLDVSIPENQRNARILIRHVKAHHLPEFNARALSRLIGGDLRETAKMDAACSELLEDRLLSPAPTRAGGGAGRQSKNFTVHPAVWRT
jgi:hypothetical protein